MPKTEIHGEQKLRPRRCSAPKRLLPFTGKNGSAGFTLVELIMVVAIIGALSMMTIPTYNAFVVRAKNSRAKSELRLLETEIAGYNLENGTPPASLASIGRDTMTDPWGNLYVYSFPPARSIFGNDLNSDFDLWCKGEDGLTDDLLSHATSQDDIVRGIDGIFLGFGYDW